MSGPLTLTLPVTLSPNPAQPLPGLGILARAELVLSPWRLVLHHQEPASPALAPPKTETLNEETILLQLLHRKDFHQAFETILDQFENKIYRFCLSYCHNPTLAEDMTQETFLRVWKGLPHFAQKSKLSTWIFVIARNTLFSELKKKSHQNTVSLEAISASPDFEDFAHETACPDPAIPLDLPNLLKQLPPKYRQVISLFYLEQQSYEAISEAMNLPMGTVKTLLHRAKKELLKIGVRSTQPPH